MKIFNRTLTTLIIFATLLTIFTVSSSAITIERPILYAKYETHIQENEQNPEKEESSSKGFLVPENNLNSNEEEKYIKTDEEIKEDAFNLLINFFEFINTLKVNRNTSEFVQKIINGFYIFLVILFLRPTFRIIKRIIRTVRSKKSNIQNPPRSSSNTINKIKPPPKNNNTYTINGQSYYSDND